MRLRRRRYVVSDAVTRQLRRRRLTRRGVVVALVLLALTALFDRFGVLRYRGDDWGTFDRQDAVVIHVVDGDTVRIRRPPAADEETVRLLGIDAPEMRHDDGSGPAHWGPEATARLREFVDDRSEERRVGKECRSRWSPNH